MLIRLRFMEITLNEESYKFFDLQTRKNNWSKNLDVDRLTP